MAISHQLDPDIYPAAFRPLKGGNEDTGPRQPGRRGWRWVEVGEQRQYPAALFSLYKKDTTAGGKLIRMLKKQMFLQLAPDEVDMRIIQYIILSFLPIEIL